MHTLLQTVLLFYVTFNSNNRMSTYINLIIRSQFAPKPKQKRQMTSNQRKKMTCPECPSAFPQASKDKI